MIKEDVLRELYVNQQLSMKEIAQELDVAVGTVFNYLKKYGIESRVEPTERTLKKWSEKRKGVPSPRKGVHLSEETKKKISEGHKGKIRNPSLYGGHRKKRSDGYIKVYVPDHPLATKDGYVMEHILVMEKAIGRYITREEVVHHKNHIKDDNRLENLELMTLSKHAKLHLSERHRNKQIKYHTVEVKNTTTGEVFHSCLEAAKKYQVAPTRISKACRQRLKLKGCEWEYLKEE